MKSNTEHLENPQVADEEIIGLVYFERKS